MIWQVMLYASGVALALSVMGYCQERLAFMRRLPRRWTWPLMMVLSIAWVAGAVMLARPAAVAPPELELRITPAGELDVVPVAASADAAVIAVGVPGGSAPTDTGWTPPADRTLLVLWVCASTLLLLWFMGARTILHRRSTRWRRAKVLGREVLVSESTGPALMGTWQPRIVVPAWFMAESAARQELILQHEEQHVTARDPLLLHAATLLAVALPWNLPLWWQLMRMRQAIEMDCDARVLRRGASLADYGDVLLVVSRRASQVPVGLIAMSAPASALERRISNLAPDAGGQSMWRALLVLLLWCFGLGAAGALEAPPLRMATPQPLREPSVPSIAAAPATAAPVAAIPVVPASPASRQRIEAELPRLLPPPKSAPSPSRREILERAIIEHHPELVSGPERDGQAFVSVQLGRDGSVERSELTYVEAGDEAGLDAAMNAALRPPRGQLLLAQGWQIAGGATVKSQIRVSYRLPPPDPAEMRERRIGSLPYEEAARVIEHYLPGALSAQSTPDRHTAYLVLSSDGRVLRSGYLRQYSDFAAILAESPGLRQGHVFMSIGRDGSELSRRLMLAWMP